MTTATLPVDLGANLRMRLGKVEDTEALVRFNESTLSDGPEDARRLEAFTRDLFSLKHPTCGPQSWTIIEDTRERKIVSAMCLIGQTWSYTGIPFGVGQPGVVSTAPAYRRRGLIREQFAYWHARSAERGQLVQVVDGIPWYYRQFGYEFAIEHLAGRICWSGAIPALPQDAREPFRIRSMTPDDFPFVMPLFERDSTRSLISSPRTADVWRYLLTGFSRDSYEHRNYSIIQTAEGAPVGYVTWFASERDPLVYVTELIAQAGQSLRALAAPVLRALKREAERNARPESRAERISLALGSSHPLYDAIPELLTPGPRQYAWYVRVPDLPAFLTHIAPALEARLAASPMAGHSGELIVSEYRSGFRLRFERGRLANVESFQPPQRVDGAMFPPLVFLQLLFGYRSLAELRATYPDCMVRDEAAVLLDILFPQHFSNVISIT